MGEKMHFSAAQGLGLPFVRTDKSAAAFSRQTCGQLGRGEWRVTEAKRLTSVGNGQQVRGRVRPTWGAPCRLPGSEPAPDSLAAAQPCRTLSGGGSESQAHLTRSVSIVYT